MAFSANVTHAEQVVLNYSSWLPTSSWVNQDVLLPYFDRIEDVTEGRVKVEMLPKVVGSPQSQYDVVRDGLADVGYIVIGYTPGRFKLAEIGGLPFLGNKAEIMSPAFHRMYEKHFAPLDEYEGVHALSTFTVSPGHVFTTKKPIRSIDNFAGLKIRSVSETTTAALQLLGATPILKSSSEAFEMLSTGVIDGSLVILENIPVANMQDMLKQGLLIEGGLSNSTLLLAMNDDKWNSISPEDQQAITEISGEAFARIIGAAYDASSDKALELVKSLGTEVHTADAEFIEALKAKLAPVDQTWIAEARESGLEDPAAVLEEFRQASATSQ
ncbi:MAG: TRAP transporter substrate-binding protein [Rhizobiaceae bacterium]|nr:TRAP transporter substrate-binding protein [Rhizobiaceae bacterium]MCV0404895.1 TRAP transporter substrate-binding protein [Rhizobiaceae bacterium]